MEDIYKYKGKSIEPLPTDIIVSDMYFGEKIVNGLVIMSDNKVERGIRPRWAKVYAVGSKVKDITVGQWILIAHGRWSRGITDSFNDATLRKVDVKDILLSTDKNMDERPI